MGAEADRFKSYRQASAAVALKLGGASFAEIAEALGLADSKVARTMVESELAARSFDPKARELLRAEAASRIERLLKSVWPKAMDSGNVEHLAAVKVARELVDRHVRLFGLDAPAEVVVHAPTASEIDQWVSRMLGGNVEELMAMEDDVIDVGEVPALDAASA